LGEGGAGTSAPKFTTGAQEKKKTGAQLADVASEVEAD